MKTFIISDTHFNHTKILTFTDYEGNKVRPFETVEEMDETLIDNWNKTVSVNDKVYHLGDVVINRRSLSLLDRLNGRKVLIRGNHDIWDTKDFLKYFTNIHGTYKLDKYILSHVPIHPDSIPLWCLCNIHGHLHNNRVKLNNEVDKRYFNASVELNNYTPIDFELIRQLHKES